MEKVKVIFDPRAKTEYDNIRNGDNAFHSQLALRYYNDLFRFPPDHWGRLRRQYGCVHFVSEDHCIFDIRATLEETAPVKTLNVLYFQLRVSGRKKHT